MPTGECRPDARSHVEPRPGAAPRTPSGRRRSGRRPDGGPGRRRAAVEVAVALTPTAERRRETSELGRGLPTRLVTLSIQ